MNTLKRTVRMRSIRINSVASSIIKLCQSVKSNEMDFSLDPFCLGAWQLGNKTTD